MSSYNQSKFLIPGTRVYNSAEEALDLLQKSSDEMKRRYELFENNAPCNDIATFNSKVSPEERLPWWLITLDEYAGLTDDPNDKKAIEEYLRVLASQSRAAGIHLIIATQKPSASNIPGNKI